MKKILSTVLLIFFTAMLVAQTRQPIIGRVHNSKQEALQNATVKILPDGEQAITDVNGMFRLATVSDRIDLLITHLGYENAIFRMQLPQRDTLMVTMESVDGLLEEVVVSGYQSSSKVNTTGSYQVIDKNLLGRTPSPDFMGQLEHITTGILFDRRETSFASHGRMPDHNVYVRGISTLRTANTGGSAPLVVLDNFPYDGDINQINPLDIEQVTILKDAAASSIWGARAGNGVIVISTKKGSYNSRVRQHVSINSQLSDKPDLYARNVIDNDTLIEVEKFLFERGYYNSRLNNRAKPVVSPVVEILSKLREGRIDSGEAALLIGGYAGRDVREDMLSHIYRNSTHQQFNYGLDGGSDLHRFAAQLGYDRMLPVQASDETSRISARIDNVFRLLPSLELAAAARYSRTASTYAPGSAFYSDNGYAHPYISLVDEAGNAAPVPHMYRTGFVDTAGNGRLLDWRFSPLEWVDNPPVAAEGQDLQLDIGLDYQLLKGLGISLKYRYFLNQNSSETHHALNSYHARNLINRGTEFIGENVLYHFPYGGILERSLGTRTGYQTRSQVDYRWQRSRHTLNALAGAEVQSSRNISEGYTLYGYDDQTLSYANAIDYTKQYPVFENLAAFETVPPNTRPLGYRTNNFVSFYMAGDYSYSDRYILSLSARRDASNLFGVATNDKWTPLWSLGISWNAHNEAFLAGSAFSLLKLRASYGYNGNIDNSMTALINIQYMGSGLLGTPYNTARITNLPNAALRWERVRTVNFGLDYGLFGNALNGAADFYVKNTYDLFDSYPLDPSVGVSSMVMNVANTYSRGIDANINYTLHRGIFRWNTAFMVSYNNNWVGNTFTDPKLPSLYTNVGNVSNIGDDMVYMVYAYQWMGLNDQGMPQGVLDGEISTNYRNIMRNPNLDELARVGSARPLWFGAYRNTFSYRDLSLSFNLAFRLKFYFKRPGLDYQQLLANNDGHRDYDMRWQKRGDELLTDVPAFVYPLNTNASLFYLNSEVHIEKGDYIRLQDIRLDYRWRFNAGKSSLASEVNVFAMVNNAGLVWRANRLGLDPETRGNIPNPCTYSLGMNLNF